MKKTSLKLRFRSIQTAPLFIARSLKRYGVRDTKRRVMGRLKAISPMTGRADAKAAATLLIAEVLVKLIPQQRKTIKNIRTAQHEAAQFDRKRRLARNAFEARTMCGAESTLH